MGLRGRPSVLKGACRPFRRAAIVPEVDLRRVAQCEAVRRNIGDHHAVCSDNRAFANRDPLHDMAAIADPGITADTDGENVARSYAGILGPQVGLPGMSVRVRYTAIERYSHVLFNDDFLGDGKADPPTDLAPILNHQPGTAYTAGTDRHIANEYVVTNVDFHLAVHERQLFQQEISAYGRTACLKQRMPVEDHYQPAGYPNDPEVSLIHDAERRFKKTRNPWGTRTDQSLGQGPQQPVYRGFAEFDLENKAIQILIIAQHLNIIKSGGPDSGDSGLLQGFCPRCLRGLDWQRLGQSRVVCGFHRDPGFRAKRVWLNGPHRPWDLTGSYGDGLQAGCARFEQFSYSKVLLMTKSEFLAELDEVLEVPRGTLQGPEKLENLEQWNSTSLIGFIALADTNNGTRISVRQTVNCVTVEDLLKLAKVDGVSA